ncbi:MAG TPA: DPP IV N-terminal domain-containing protein [Thermomicrobiales bacterium]|nr:DPP IV N-terminal domain-containing protein [Thermomicrobiales bacterium]
MTTDRPVVTRQDYARAESFLPWNVDKLVFRMGVEPQWIDDSERFWYRNRTRNGVEFVLVDPDAGSREPAFDHVRLAAALTHASGRPTTHDQLPLEELDLNEAGSVQFHAHQRRWECDLDTYECREIAKPVERGVGSLKSPDGKREAFVRSHNLWVREVESGEERQLTDDGERYNDYASLPEGRTSAVSDRLSGKKIPPSAVWAPDSTKLLTHRLDQRQVSEMWLLQGHPGGDGARAVPHSYRMPLPGDAELAQAQLVIIEATTAARVDVQADPIACVAFAPPERGYAGWCSGSDRAWFTGRERGFLAASLHVIDASTGATTQIVEERGQTLTVPHLSPTTDKPMAWVSRDGSEAIWHSQRDGWGHLYLYGANGQVTRQLTSGPWVVRELLHVDEDGRIAFFTASGREPGQYPYQRLLCRISVNGGEVTVLSPEDADHQVTASKSGRFFVDSYSRPDLPPVSVVRDRNGAVVVPLEEADISGLLTAGWHSPQRLTLKARDGVTDIHATIVRPTNYDPTRRYPVLDSIYPGPQRVQAPVGFPGPETSAIAGFWAAQSLAELGFVVVMIDGQWMPFRSKAFHDYAYANFEDGGGLPDHIAALRQLAARDPSLDLSRVGIFGHSGGGYASVKALLQHPDFFTVAVSSSGNHDQRGYMAEWGEMYLGMPDVNPDAWEAQSNLPLVANLRGKLLLVWGEMDDNVHPALTIQLIDAFIKAGKDVDMLVLPNANHGFIDLVHAPKDTRGNSPNNHFFLRKRWDYFVQHLLGAEPPVGYVIGADRT